MAIIQLKVLQDADGRILAAVSDADNTEGAHLAILPAAGQRLVRVEVPATHSALSMGQLFKCLRIHEQRVVVGDPPEVKK